METTHIAKIRSGVVDCLHVCRSADKPFTKLKAFVDGLKADPNWTADEIIELLTRVIRELR